MSTFCAGVCWRVSLHTHTHTTKFSADLLVRLSSCRISAYVILSNNGPRLATQIVVQPEVSKRLFCVQGFPRQHHQVRYGAHLPILLCIQCQQLMQAASTDLLAFLLGRLVKFTDHAGNAFGIYPKTGWRTASIILMIGHQAVAFMLFVRISSLRLC